MKKQLTLVALSAGILASSFTPAVLAAENNQVSYDFKIYNYYQNGKDATGRYRTTTNTQNSWKVKMVLSGEGSGTISQFWMEDSNNTNTTLPLDITEGHAYRYSATFSNAGKKYNYLTAQNNNYSSQTYNVYGYWDEETGKIVD